MYFFIMYRVSRKKLPSAYHLKVFFLSSYLTALRAHTARQASTVGELVGVGVIMPETRGGWRVGSIQGARGATGSKLLDWGQNLLSHLPAEGCVVRKVRVNEHSRTGLPINLNNWGCCIVDLHFRFFIILPISMSHCSRPILM